MLFGRRPQEPQIHIVGCPRTRITEDRFHTIIQEYEKIPKGRWLFNLGNGNYGSETTYENRGYNIINKTRNIKNCSNKKLMFRILHRHRVPTLGYYDLTRNEDRDRARNHLRNGGQICLRRKKALRRIKTVAGFNKLYANYPYATAQEFKKYEYRVVMLRDKPIVTYIKNPHEGKTLFKYKQEDCSFARVTFINQNNNIIRACKEATRALGIDMCGIDVMVNIQGEAKIIEVNSGNGMAGRTIKKIMKTLRKWER